MWELWSEYGQIGLAILVAVIIRFLMTEDTNPPVTKKQKIAAALSGAMCAFLGAPHVADTYARGSVDLGWIAFLLGLTGYDIVKIVLKRAPEIINLFFTGISKKAAGLGGKVMDLVSRIRLSPPETPPRREGRDDNES